MIVIDLASANSSEAWARKSLVYDEEMPHPEPTFRASAQYAVLMTGKIDAGRVRSWIDSDLVGNIEQVPDEAAVFNILVEISNINIHIIRQDSDGPLIIGQQIEYGDNIRSRIQAMSNPDRNELVARIRETLTGLPIIYGFHDELGANVQFVEMFRIFLEHRIYPNAVTQQSLMTGLIDVWKALQYLDDITTLIDSVEG